MLTQAYNEGRDAAFNYAFLPVGERKPLNRTCPYSADNPLASEWQEGWNDSMQELEMSVKPIVVTIPRS
jgi:hypothetical protein